MLQWFTQPLPWYVGGPLIGLTVPMLLLLGNKQMGISSSLRHFCAACLPVRSAFFKYDWREHSWNLVFVAGIFLGGLLTALFLGTDQPIALNPDFVATLENQGIRATDGFLPAQIFGLDYFTRSANLLLILVGGFLVGFGTRYAGGCTSGHSIMGIANLQWPSLIATLCFMIGGFLSTHFLLPLFF